MLRYWYISNRYIKTHHNHPYRHNYNHLSLIPIESYKQYKLKKNASHLTSPMPLGGQGQQVLSRDVRLGT